MLGWVIAVRKPSNSCAKMQSLFRFQLRVSEKATLMILRLLKKLRTTVRKNPQEIISSRCSEGSVERALVAFGAEAQCTAGTLASWSVRYAKPIGIATCGTLMAFTSLLPGQEFRAPNFPSPPPAPIEQPTEQVNGQYSNSRASYDSQSSSYENQSHGSERNSFLEQKLEYARQLRAQMERAGREQGASPEFAEKAYQAQQAYLAEQAFLEHQAYQQELTRQPRTYQPSPKPNPVRPEASAKQYDVAHAGYQTPPTTTRKKLAESQVPTRLQFTLLRLRPSPFQGCRIPLRRTLKISWRATSTARAGTTCVTAVQSRLSLVWLSVCPNLGLSLIHI